MWCSFGLSGFTGVTGTPPNPFSATWEERKKELFQAILPLNRERKLPSHRGFSCWITFCGWIPLTFPTQLPLGEGCSEAHRDRRLPEMVLMVVGLPSWCCPAIYLISVEKGRPSLVKKGFLLWLLVISSTPRRFLLLVLSII